MAIAVKCCCEIGVIGLDCEPMFGEFEPLGSTRFANGTGLSEADLHASKFTPGAWIGERLIKVDPLVSILRDATIRSDVFHQATSAGQAYTICNG